MISITYIIKYTYEQRCKMKKCLIVLIAFVLIGCTAFAKVNYIPGDKADIAVSKQMNLNKDKIAVLPFIRVGLKKQEFDPFTTDRISLCLMKNGFKVIERLYLQQIVNELNLEKTGLLKQEDVQRIGKVYKIDMLVLGNIEYYDYYPNSITIRFIDVETGEVMISGACGHLGIYQIEYMIDELCYGIAKKIKN
jgi:PBP1b-binding outer membrane lipoprotein LpoB